MLRYKLASHFIDVVTLVTRSGFYKLLACSPNVPRGLLRQ